METESPNSLSASTVLVRVEQFQTTAIDFIQQDTKSTCRHRAEASSFTSGTWLKKKFEIKT